ncbi:SinI-like, DNA-binding domain [uncultured Caudovirales phage]|uniref:SinI-like, DNA-binding domain n=1 Tax=uncultured Caudovirales phage TaxID=2100421 RepID=A0A6J5KPX6_9CAUD|nr:SinI-like, DNA-binding domain [uncultured Caudovirales phage]CAB4123958.1 SinI-like, DNA-binding domain [uncultured Caudovirales phage]CAB5219510.1 SinI-like, DNA-binding domain [uncultured Caudovirales phage]
MDIEECAALLKVDRTTILRLAQNGEIPGGKIGRAWVFIEQDMLDYLRRKIANQMTERRALVDEQLRPKLQSVVREVRNRGGQRRVLPKLPEPLSEVASS